MLFLQFVFKQKASERTIDVIRDEKEGKTEKERERKKTLCIYLCVCDEQETRSAKATNFSGNC